MTAAVLASLTMSVGATVASMGSGPDGRSADTAPMISALADTDPPAEDERENSSAGWWIVGGVIGAGALAGIVVGASLPSGRATG